MLSDDRRYKHDGEIFKFKLQSSGGFCFTCINERKKVGYCHQIKKVEKLEWGRVYGVDG